MRILSDLINSMNERFELAGKAREFHTKHPTWKEDFKEYADAHRNPDTTETFAPSDTKRIGFFNMPTAALRDHLAPGEDLVKKVYDWKATRQAPNTENPFFSEVAKRNNNPMPNIGMPSRASKPDITEIMRKQTLGLPLDREEEEAYQDYIGQFKQIQQFARGGKVKATAHDKGIEGNPDEGHLIIGLGGGQDDTVPYDNLKEGSFVFDASTVSDIGDGSSKEGALRLKQLEKSIKQRISKLKPKGLKPVGTSISITSVTKRNIPALLSDSEYVMPSHVVDMIGEGKNDKGAAILERMRNLIRKDKQRKAGKIPAKAKDITVYLKKAGGQV
jgi:hypothetical protein